ncbi:MAG: hypothetical protein SFY66_08950 [Oculatellaceae cyanobacterium bins.114]|nr:hypothetical protein [Oculatellaceae cyanobacterium bins.114]
MKIVVGMDHKVPHPGNSLLVTRRSQNRVLSSFEEGNQLPL